MPENEFEKKVSSELQQLRFKPSEAVWMKVEERIRKKKRRRVFIILFLLAGIALLGYWQWDNFFGETKGGIVKTGTPVQADNDATTRNEPNVKEDDKSNTESKEIKTADKKNTDNEKKVTKTDILTNKNANNIPIQPVVEKKKNVPSIEKKKNDPKENKKASRPAKDKTVVLTDAELAIVTVNDATTKKDTSEVKHVDNDNVNKDLDPVDKSNDKKVDVVKIDTALKQ